MNKIKGQAAATEPENDNSAQGEIRSQGENIMLEPEITAHVDLMRFEIAGGYSEAIPESALDVMAYDLYLTLEVGVSPERCGQAAVLFLQALRGLGWVVQPPA